MKSELNQKKPSPLSDSCHLGWVNESSDLVTSKSCQESVFSITLGAVPNRRQGLRENP